MTPPRGRSAEAAEIQRWLMDVPHVADGGAGFMRALAGRLVAAGLPVWRISYALQTMHPEVLWRTVRWEQGDAVTLVDQPYARLLDPFYTQSPVARLREGAGVVRVRLVDGPLPYSICEELRARGGTDYCAYGLQFASGPVTYIAYATRSEAGFDEEDLAVFAAIVPFLARRIELESAYYATRALLDVYLGRNAARRVLAGEFQRGRGELIDAAIWYSDMRGFTALSERCTPTQLIETLDATFDAVASAVAVHGGEVLKFIGDAVLAIFPVGEDPGDACRRGLAAADEAFAALARLNHARAPEDALAIGVALHRGQVMYGNIGARERLDFTVISSAVNEATRLEALCKQLATPLALSEVFVTTAGLTGLEDLGAHALKGVRAPLRVFTRRSPGHGESG